MNHRPASEIIIPENRMRREFDAEAIQDLAESIWRLGQLQPVVLDAEGNLVVGERRHRAITLISTPEWQAAHGTEPSLGSGSAGVGLVSYVLRTDLDEVAALEAELEENTRRVDLTWQEQAAATARLHTLRTEQKGPASPSNPSGQTMADTAEEIFGREPTSGDRMKVSDALVLQEFLDDPLVAAAPSEREAMKVINQLHKAKERKDAADRWDPNKSNHQVHHADAYDWLTSESIGFDVVICDPPYGRDMQKHTFEKEHEYDDSRSAFERFCSEMPEKLFAHAKTKAHGYIFCDIRNFNDLFVAFEIAGWTCWALPLIWDKGNVGSFGKATLGPRHCYDAILYVNKGDRETIAMYSDVLKVNQEQALDHPAGKPVDLYYDLLRRSVSAGMTAFDPMVGGGTFFAGCQRAKVRGIGVEFEEKYYHMAVNAIQAIKA